MFVLDLFNTKYEKELREGAVDKVVSEGGPYDLPGKDYDRPGDTPRRPRPQGDTSPRRHPDDPDFMDPDQRRLRADQERVRKANAEYHAKKKSGVEEGVWDAVKKSFTPDPNWQKRANQQAGHMAQGAVAGGAHGHAVGHSMADAGVAEDGALDKYRERLGTQGNIQSQNQRHQDWLDAHHQSSLDRMTNYRDAMNRLYQAGTDDTIARQEIRRERMRKDDDDWQDTFDMMRDRLNRYQYSSQRDVDPEQLEKISNIKYNSKRKRVKEGAGRAVNDKGLTQHQWLQLVQTKFPDAKIVQAKMIDGPCRATLPDGRTLSWTKVDQGTDGNNNSTGGVKPVGTGKFNPEFNKALQTGIDQRTAARDKMQANVATLPTYTKKGVAESTGQFHVYHKVKGDRMGGPDYELLKSFPDKNSAVVFAKSYNEKHGYKRGGFHGAVIRTTTPAQGVAEGNGRLNEFAPSASGGSGDYFQALASAWYNGAFDTGSLEKGIKSKEDVERLLNRGIIGPDGVTRKYAIDYNSTFEGVVISSDDYYEHSDYNDQGQEVDSRNGRPWGPYDYMEFDDEELDEGMAEGASISGDGGAVDNFKQQMANRTEIAYQKGMAEAKKKSKKKKSPRSLGRYFFPGYGYYGSGESGEGGGDGGGGEGESVNRAEAKGNINELSTDKLAQYKTAAALDAGAADKRGDYERGDKRFAGIIKATKKQFANDLKKHGSQGMAEGSSTASDAVERAILNRIMVQHTDLLMRFGPDKVMQAAEEVAYNVGDVDEIGTSDVSAYVNQVRQILGAR